MLYLIFVFFFFGGRGCEGVPLYSLYSLADWWFGEAGGGRERETEARGFEMSVSECPCVWVQEGGEGGGG